MNLLKVICNSAPGTAVYEFGKKEKAYDYDKSSLLVNCIAQVFYNTPPKWSGNIEVYFELKGKNYCAGRKISAGKSSSYLAGEVKGKLLLFAFDSESMRAYLDDETGGNFDSVLERCLLTEEAFRNFAADPDAGVFGVIKKAREESALLFNVALVETLKAQTAAKKVKKSEVDAISSELDNAKEQNEVLLRSLSDMKAESEELAELIRRNDRSKEINAELEKLDIRQKELDKRKDKLADNGKIREALKLRERNEEIEKEIAEAEEEKRNEEKTTALLVTAQAFADKLNEDKKARERKEQLEERVRELEDNKKSLEEKKEDLKREKEEWEKERALEKEQNTQQSEEEQKVAEQRTLDEEKEKQLSKEKEDLLSEKEALSERLKNAEKELRELESSGLTQKKFDEEREKEAESLRRAEEAEKQRDAQIADRENFEKELAFLREEAEGYRSERNTLEKDKAAVETEIVEINFDIDPKNSLSSTKKYFGRGYTPFGYYKKKKEQEARLAEAEKEVSDYAVRIDELSAKTDNLLEEIEKRSASGPEGNRDVVIPEIYRAPSYDYDGVCGEYVEALKKGKGEAFINEKRNVYEELHAKDKHLDEKIAACDEQINSLGQAAPEKSSEEPSVQPDEKPFEKEEELARCEEEYEQVNSEIARLNGEIEKTAHSEENEPSEEIKPYVDDPSAIPVLMSDAAMRRKQADDKIKNLRKEKENNENRVNEISGELKTAPEELESKLVPQEEEELIGKEENEISEKKEQLLKELDEKDPETEKADERYAQLTASSAETENALIANQEEIKKLNEKYEAKKADYEAYKASKAELEAAMAAVEAVPERRFVSNTAASDYLAEYEKHAGEIFSSLMGDEYSLQISEGFKVMKAGEELPWDTLSSDDKLMTYLSLARALPETEGIKADWLLVDGAAVEDKERMEKAYEILKAPHAFKTEFSEREKTAGSDEPENETDQNETDEVTLDPETVTSDPETGTQQLAPGPETSESDPDAQQPAPGPETSESDSDAQQPAPGPEDQETEQPDENNEDPLPEKETLPS